MRPLPFLFLFAPIGALAGEPALELKPTGLLQTWITAFDQDEDPQADPAGYGDVEADPGFAIARARLGVIAKYGVLDGEITFGTGTPYDIWQRGNPDIGLVDAVARVTLEGEPGALRFGLGTQKVPFSREVLISSADLLFQERGVSANWLSPNRETGFVADFEGSFGGRVRAGVFNGNGSFLGDDNIGVLTTLRAEWGHGDTYLTYGTENAYGVAVSGLYDVGLATTKAGGAADALVRVGPVSLLVEAQAVRIAPKGEVNVAPPEVSDPTLQIGGLAQLSAYVPLSRGGLDFGARFSLFDDATKLHNNGDVGILHAGLTWRQPIKALDVGLGFIHREELAGRRINNDTARLWVQLAFPARPRFQKGEAGDPPADTDDGT